MAIEVHVRRLTKSWQYDFKLPGRSRERKGGYRTKAAAYAAGLKRLRELETGACKITFTDAYETYMAATVMKDRARDTYQHHWTRIEPFLGHYFIEEVETSLLDSFKQSLPAKLGPRTVHHHMTLIRAILRFMWKRGKLKYVPYIPTEKVPKKHQDWYTEEERDKFLTGMFRMYPQWYLFFYLTCRLGLRRGEVYAISRRQIRHIPQCLIVDQQVQIGTKTRPAILTSRKNNEAFSLEFSQDVMDAINWHIEKGYAGEEFLFSKTGKFPTWLDSHMRPLRTVQSKIGLRPLGHHAIGRHSVASQAATKGESIKAIQSQLGHRSEQATHRYAHLGSKAQLRVVEALEPASPPHLRSGT
ncbi:MAG: tyrosine-type recombinase/integrase [Proteobacteria bacterium]|nr:tyrosine-type recombinase/integrase [Pseudomonadota bacterium]